MPIQHRDLTDPQLHEPKGVADATDGEVYVANGVGGGNWIDVSLVNPHNTIAFADRVQSSGDPAQDVVLVAASVDTLRDYGDFVAFTGQMVGQPDIRGIAFDDYGDFIVPVAGIYQFNFWLSESNNISDGELGISLYKNQDVGRLVPSDPPVLTGQIFGPVMRDKTKTATDINTLALSGTISLGAGDVLGIAMASVVSGTVSMSDASMSLILLEDLS